MGARERSKSSRLRFPTSYGPKLTRLIKSAVHMKWIIVLIIAL
jgi:hypothetical protein